MPNHTPGVKEVMGQTSFNANLIKSNVLVMGTCRA
jgi:hypothetical protein